jgi:hypothetical protein
MAGTTCQDIAPNYLNKYVTRGRPGSAPEVLAEWRLCGNSCLTATVHSPPASRIHRLPYQASIGKGPGSGRPASRGSVGRIPGAGVILAHKRAEPFVTPCLPATCIPWRWVVDRIVGGLGMARTSLPTGAGGINRPLSYRARSMPCARRRDGSGERWRAWTGQVDFRREKKLNHRLGSAVAPGHAPSAVPPRGFEPRFRP